jgi:hypothetical protein
METVSGLSAQTDDAKSVVKKQNRRADRRKTDDSSKRLSKDKRDDLSNPSMQGIGQKSGPPADFVVSNYCYD